MNYKITYSNEYLAHHGILGQKWGIRRYRNYDGTYTQAGLKRYDAAKKRSDKAKEDYKSAKKAYKEGLATKDEVRSKRDAMKAAKRETNKHYKHLELDRLGDQGKDLYRRGKTITGNHVVTSNLATGASLLAYAAHTYGDQKTRPLMYGGAGVLGTMALGKECIDAYQNKRLRAYYAHTSKY